MNKANCTLVQSKDRQRNNCRIFFPLTLPSPTEGEGTSDSYFFADPKCRFACIFCWLALMGFGVLAAVPLAAAELHVGAATVDITPDQPVALDGQRHVRISKKPATPIYAVALALESREGDQVLDQAIIVSCDLVAIRQGILAKVRDKLADRLPDFDLRKLFLCATHTHTAPVTEDGKYSLPETGIMQPGQYADWMAGRVADAVVQAWQARQPGKVAWGQS